VLERPKECQAPSGIPVLRAERLEFATPPELRPSLERAETPALERAELAALPNECQWPSLMAAGRFDERFPDEPELRPVSDPPL